MAYIYSDPTREQDDHALPNIEVFQLTAADVAAGPGYDDERAEFMTRREFRLASMNGRTRERMIDAMIEELDIRGGWYWQACFPGCLPDGDAIGPFDSYAEAKADAQSQD